MENVENLGLPHFDATQKSMSNNNPIISTLFEIGYKNDNLNEQFSERTFKYQLTKNNIKLYVYLYKEDDLLDVINKLSNIEKLNIKQYDKTGEIINHIPINIRTKKYDYKITQSLEDKSENVYIIFTLNDIEIR